MRHSLQLRAGQTSDAAGLAVLAAQVWLHTYAANGIHGEIVPQAGQPTPAGFPSLRGLLKSSDVTPR